MHRKSLIIYSIATIIFIITIFLLIFIKIDTYEKALLISHENTTKIVMDEKAYLKIKNNKSLSFNVSGKKFKQKVLDKDVEEKLYYCTIENIQEFSNKVIPINLNTGTKNIIF